MEAPPDSNSDIESPDDSEPNKDGAAEMRTGRVARTAGVGGLVAGQSLKWARTSVANLTRGEERSRQRTDDRAAPAHRAQAPQPVPFHRSGPTGLRVARRWVRLIG